MSPSEQAELVRDALNDAGCEHARRITDREAEAVYSAVRLDVLHALQASDEASAMPLDPA